MGAPIGPIPRDGRVGQRRRKGVRTGLNADIGLIDFAQFQIGPMHMDQPLFRTRHIQQRIAVGGIFPEPRVDGEDHIGVADQRFDRWDHAHPGLAAEHRRMIVELILIAEHRHHGNVTGLGKSLQRRAPRDRPETVQLQPP